MEPGRRVTVFGGSGFIGRYVVRRLAQQGWIVRACVRDPVAAAFLKPMGNVGQVVPMRTNLADDDAALAAAVQGADAVVNLVGILAESGTQTFDALQAEGPARLARAAKAAGATSFVQVSALGADANSASKYARTKAAGEAGVRAAFPDATIVRPSIVIGAEDGFFNRFAQMATWLPALPLIGGGETKFQPVYVADVAEAIVRAIDNPAARGKTFEAVGPRVYTFRELMEYLLATIDRHRGLIPVPWPLAEIQGTIMGMLPIKLLTRDQVELLKTDNVGTGAPGLEAFGIVPAAMEVVAPVYLAAYRRGGRFAKTAANA
ncbi:MAG: complex I NDUFA9 subunit family protein [Rhodospirillales bacterium]|nr:complex I NDUFA9 subunit family protein [Rhodospirillales bacterium]